MRCTLLWKIVPSIFDHERAQTYKTFLKLKWTFLSWFLLTIHKNWLFHILKFVWKHRRLQITKAVRRKKNTAGAIRLPDFRLYYRAIVIKTVWNWLQNRNTDHQNRIESPEINPWTYDQLIYDEVGKNI